MFHRVHSWTSRLSGATADDRVLLALSGVEDEAGDRVVRAAVEQLRRSLVARRQVEVCMARAVACGRGSGRSEDRVRARIGRGVSRTRQLEVLVEDHEAAMVRLVGVHEAFTSAVARLRRRQPRSRDVQSLLELCAAEERAYQRLFARYADDRLGLENLVGRWQVLAAAERRAA